MESNDVLSVLADDLEQKMGSTVQRGKKRLGEIPRPVFFGDEGSYLRTYEIDAFEPTRGELLARAQVHATLAVAASVGLSAHLPMPDQHAWQEVAGSPFTG